MRSLFKMLLIAIIFTAYACHKDNADPTVLTGKWTMSEVYLSAGGPGWWQPATDKSLYVKFGSGGSLEGIAFPGYVTYALKDSVTVSFTKTDKTVQSYHYTLKNGNLEMSPTPTYCTEGCGTRFVKASN